MNPKPPFNPRTQLSTQELAFLEARGFNYSRFQEPQSLIRTGALSTKDSIFQGRLEVPHPEDVSNLAPLGTQAAGELQALGEKAFAQGAVAVVVLAGGMATRFGGG